MNNASKRIVQMFFTGSTLLAWGIFTKTFELLFSIVGVRDAHLLGKGFTLSTLLGAAAAVAVLFYTLRHPQVRPMVNEVGDELTKVVWPNLDEVKTNTRLTVLVTLIIAVILWMFDQVFGHFTSILLGGGAT
jgi:preprotein translocase subunit SecE